MAEPPAYLLDVNVLVALTLSTHQHHRVAHAYLADIPACATCPTTEAGLLRLLLNPAVTGRPVPFVEVRAVLRGLRGDPRWRFVPDGASLADPVIDVAVLMGHRQVTDVQLVNLAATAGARLATFDSSLPASLSPQDRRHVVLVPI